VRCTVTTRVVLPTEQVPFRKILGDCSLSIICPASLRTSGADLHIVQLFLDHANISTSSRYLKPSKLALHTTIQRIDAQRRASGEAAKWEQDLAEMKKNLQAMPQKPHKLVESTAVQGSEKTATAR
jgi:hypothetical protein